MGKPVQLLLPIERETPPARLPPEVTRELLQGIAALLAQLARLQHAKETDDDHRS